MWCKNPVKCPKGVYSFASNCCQWINKVKCPLPFVQQWAECRCWISSKQDISPTVCYRKTQMQSSFLQIRRIPPNLKISVTQLNSLEKSIISPCMSAVKSLDHLQWEILIPRQNEVLLRIACSCTYQVSYNTQQVSFHTIFHAWFLNSKGPFVMNGGYVDKAQHVGIY